MPGYDEKLAVVEKIRGDYLQSHSMSPESSTAGMAHRRLLPPSASSPQRTRTAQCRCSTVKKRHTVWDKFSRRHGHVIQSRHENRMADLEHSDRMYFDPDTIVLLRTTLDHVWAGLPPTQRALTSQSLLAERILRAAARGERDPGRLHTQALSEWTDLKIAS
jgi:hypothetical protein